ncbi:MAG TPA: hypothetical protein VKT78_12335 [Fimbriimonadaceae bacterium]|nr:hypothetical protein [Fimbriimonadaceae bacterium]
MRLPFARALVALALLSSSAVADFVVDGTSLPPTKTNLRPIPNGADPARYWQASDYNALMGAALDLRNAVVAGKYHGLSLLAADPTPGNATTYLWAKTDFGLHLKINGHDNQVAYGQVIDKGDLLAFNGTRFGVLPIGADGSCFLADSTSSAGVNWGACGGAVTNLTTDITWQYAAATARHIFPNSASTGNAGDDLYVYAGDGDAVGTAAGNLHLNGGHSLGVSNGKLYLGDLQGDVRIGDGLDTIYLLSSTYVQSPFVGPGAPAVAGDHQGAFNLSTNDSLDHIAATYTPQLASTCISVFYTVQLDDQPNTVTRTAEAVVSFRKTGGNWVLSEQQTIVAPTAASLPTPQVTTDTSVIQFHIHPGFANNYTWRGFFTVIER